MIDARLLAVVVELGLTVDDHRGRSEGVSARRGGSGTTGGR